MQVSTLTVKPDHVQVSLTENLLSFLGLFPSFDSLFVCYFFGVFLSLFPTFSVPLLHGHVDMALDHLFVFVSTSPRYFFQRAFVFHLPCFFVVLCRSYLPFLFTCMYVVLSCVGGLVFLLTVRYHLSMGNYKDSRLFRFLRDYSDFFTPFLALAQYLAYWHSDYQIVCMLQFSSCIYLQFKTQDIVEDAIAFHEGRIPPADFQTIIQWGNLAQQFAVFYAPVILVCPDSLLSAFFIKLTLLDVARNVQAVRDAVMRHGLTWFIEPESVVDVSTFVLSFFRVNPQWFSNTELLNGFSNALLNEEVVNLFVDRFCQDEVFLAEANRAVHLLFNRVGLLRVFRVLKLERFVLSAGEAHWFAPVLAAQECTVSELLSVIDSKDPDCCAIRELVNRRFPGSIEDIDFDDLDAGHLCEIALRKSTLSQILALLTQKYIDDPLRISDNECVDFLVDFMQYMSYGVRSVILSSWPYADPAVGVILRQHFHSMNPIQRQIFMHEWLEFVIALRPEWSSLTLGSFRGVWLLEDQRPECVAARIAGGELE